MYIKHIPIVYDINVALIAPSNPKWGIRYIFKSMLTIAIVPLPNKFNLAPSIPTELNVHVYKRKNAIITDVIANNIISDVLIMYSSP